MNTESTLENIAPLEIYRESRGSIFPSESSMRWWMRQHREQAVSAGALLMIRGTWFAHAKKLDELVLSEGQREAAAQVGQ